MHPKLNLSEYHLVFEDDKEDFVEFSQFETLQEELNSYKNKFATIDRRDILSLQTDWHRGLKKHITRFLNGQVVTKAWLKLHEILSHTKILDQMFVKCAEEKRPFTFFCNAELPGAFLSCLNHHICTHPQGPKSWDWLASSLLNGDGKCLEDTHGLYKNYRSHWLQNDSMDGDVTKPENVTSMAERVCAKFVGGVDLYTSDGGTDVRENPNQQESLTSLVRLGEIIEGLLVVRKGGCMILKYYTFHKKFSCYMLTFLASRFRKCLLLKPETSPGRNSEIYICLIDYVNCVTSDSKEGKFLLEMLKFCNVKKCFPTALAPSSYIWSIPRKFGNQLVMVAKEITRYQCLGLKFYLDLSKTSFDPKGLSRYASLISTDYLQKYPIRSLPIRRQLRTNVHRSGHHVVSQNVRVIAPKVENKNKRQKMDDVMSGNH